MTFDIEMSRLSLMVLVMCLVDISVIKTGFDYNDTVFVVENKRNFINDCYKRFTAAVLKL